jgi:2-methylcitrate dehydratase PrpD
LEKHLPDVLAWLFEFDPLGDQAVETRARQLFLDTLGCMIAGMAQYQSKETWRGIAPV